MRIVSLVFLVVFCPGLLAQGHAHAPSPAAPKKKEAPAAKTETKEESRAPIDVPEPQQRKMGVKTSKAVKKPVEHTIRTVGTVTADQTKEAHVHTRINGWIEQIYADYIGKPVRKGEPLFDLYSPDLVSTQEEFLAALRQGGAAREISAAAADRLKLWGVPDAEIARIRKAGKAKRALTFVSPVDGAIINKTAIKGMYITPEMELYHIADLSRVWVIVTLYEYDVAAISSGDLAEIQLPYDPNQALSAKISYVYPEIDLETRTAKARIELDNSKQKLKPGMFATVQIKKKLGESVVIPDDAVVDTGTRRIVFAKTSAVRFEPKEVKIGPRVGNEFIVLSGIKEGEEVVTGASFLIDAESKLQAALRAGQSTSSGHSGH